MNDQWNNDARPSAAGGVVEKVTIYPSEYGLERMKEEETSGPKELVQSCRKDLLLSPMQWDLVPKN